MCKEAAAFYILQYNVCEDNYLSWNTLNSYIKFVFMYSISDSW
jgi:hypothetical protein